MDRPVDSFAMPDRRDVRFDIRVSRSDATAIEEFRFREKLPSSAAAVRLIIEIGLETVSKRGRRFWDKSTDEL